jgi:predicted AlkP superfamily pyrophosphatase or phosphodiesterase
LVLVLCLFAGDVIARSNPDIKLVLQITVDGLRADLLSRYSSGFGKDGFLYLMNKGAVYNNAHYQHANTETIVGHATLATGAFPAQHGMIGNVWYDREAEELAYNIEDPDAPLLPTRAQETEGEQVDPAQKKARTSGRSPRALQAPTFSDGLSAFYSGRSKVFGVSGKDRSAVAMAGQSGKAFWFSTNNGDFVTSRYYYEQYPDWAQQWNARRKAEKLAGSEWKLAFDPASYHLIDQDDRAYEADLKGYGRTFPHRFGSIEDKLLYTQVLVSPFGDQLLLDFSKALIKNEKLGQDAISDYLSISFSSVDAVNHFFGPSSLENEEVVRQLDRTLAELLDYIDDAIGLEHTLIVFSADHGMADMPEYMSELGYAAGRLEPDEIVDVANKAGQQLGLDNVVRFFFRPYLYLDDAKTSAAKLELAEVEQAIADALTDMEGIELAVSARNMNKYGGHALVEQVQKNQHVTRSGDIYVAQQPYWFLFDKGAVVAMHGSPWRYDTHVPIIFAGPGISPQRIQRLVHPVDVSPTIAALLGMTPPAASNGSVLLELFESNGM